MSPLRKIDVPLSGLTPLIEESEHSDSQLDPSKLVLVSTISTVEEEETTQGVKIVGELPSRLEIKEGEDLKLSCVIETPAGMTGSDVEIAWWKNGCPLKDDYRIDIYNDRLSRHLEICDVRLSDAGEYSVVAKSPVDKVESSCTVVVLESPSRARARRPQIEGLYHYGSTRKETYRPPEFVQKPTSQIVHEGKKLKTSCKVSGVPRPQIAWFREGRQLRLDIDQRLHIYDDENEPNVSYFEIDNTSILDSGEYTCTASNIMGAVFCSILVTIEAMTEPDSSDIHSDMEKSETTTNPNTDGSNVFLTILTRLKN